MAPETTPATVAQPERPAQPIQPARPEAREVQVSRISEQLAAQIALGNFKKDATAQEIQDQVGKQPPTEVSQDTYKALQAQHDMRRDQDAAYIKELLIRDYDKASDKKGKQNPRAMSADALHNALVSNWGFRETKLLFEDFLNIRTNGGPEAAIHVMNIMNDKLGFNITKEQLQNPLPFFQANMTAFYDVQHDKPGSFYTEFCTGDTNKKLAKALTAQEMYDTQGFLVRLLGSEEAFDALVALRQTQDKLQANQPLSPAVTGNQLKQGEDKILDFYRNGLDLANKKTPTTRPTVATQPSPDTTPSTLLSPEDQRKVDEAKKLVFENEASQNPEKHIQLIQEATKELQAEKAKGKGKLGKTIHETAQSTVGQEAKAKRETISDGSVVYIPSIPGERVISIGDIHGDLETVKQILKREGFFEDMVQNPPSLRLVFLGDLVDRGPKSIEVMTAVMQLKLLYGDRVHIISADHDTVKDTVSPHDFPDRLKQKFGRGFGADAYGTYSSLFDAMAKMVVTEDGVAMVHGGPPGLKDATLQTVARFDEQDKDGLLRENMVWGDPIVNSPVDIEKTKADLIKQFSYYYAYAQSKNATEDMYMTVNTQIGPRNLKIGDIKKAIPLLQQLPIGMLPNPGRSTGLYFDALFGGTSEYNETAFETFLQNIGATVMIRGHQVSDETDGSKPNFYQDRLWTIHSTGTGSSESHYARRENHPRYAVFTSGQRLQSIDSKQNIQDVWTDKPVQSPQPRIARTWTPSKPTLAATYKTNPLTDRLNPNIKRTETRTTTEV